MPSRTLTNTPLARSEDLLIERVGDELVIYDLERKEAHCLKALAASVFDRCDGKGSLEQLAARVSSDLGEPVTESDVLEAIRQLEASALLAQPLVVRDGVSRREAVKRFAFAGAAGAIGGPLITSILAPGTAWASGIPTGCTGCVSNSSCVSNHCCQSNAGKQCNQSCCVGKDNSCHTVCGATTCVCTVCVSTTGCGTCPCSTCPPGSTVCCTTSC